MTEEESSNLSPTKDNQNDIIFISREEKCLSTTSQHSDSLIVKENVAEEENKQMSAAEKIPPILIEYINFVRTIRFNEKPYYHILFEMFKRELNNL